MTRASKQCAHNTNNDGDDEHTPLLRPEQRAGISIISRSVSGSSSGTKCDTYSSSSSSTLDAPSDDEHTAAKDDDDDGDDVPKKETPLDWWQFSLILFLQLAEALTSQVINPFVPQVSSSSTLLGVLRRLRHVGLFLPRSS